CLKAMALRPQDRYASAKALADDVEHWLADEPTTAYREPRAQRLARWTRRHRTAVAVGSVALVLTAAAAPGGLWLWAEAEQRREQRLFSAGQQRLAEQREYLSGLRAAAEADERLAVAELRAGRLASAKQILAQTLRRVEKEPDLAPLRARLEGRYDRVRRL